MKTKETIGYFLRKAPPLVLTVAASIAEAARPVIGPPVPGTETTPVWLDDKAILLNLLLSAGTLIMILSKFIWNSERKRLKKIEEAVEHIPQLVAKVTQMDGHVKSLPTKDQVELMILLKILDEKKGQGKHT